MALSPVILVVDDDEAICDACLDVLRPEGYQVSAVQDPRAGLKLVCERGVDLVLCDLRMPHVDGLEFLRLAKADDPELVLLMITAYGTVETAVQAMKNGAYDFLAKPFSPDELRLAVRRGLEMRRLTLQNRALKQELRGHRGPERDPDFVLGVSPAMREVRDIVSKVAPSDSTVLLLGETGTGKEVIARLIHQSSFRRQEPFLAVDCGSLVETLFESELFGHCKGSFTGAVATKYGRFELANGGTLFFDEIANIRPQVQAKLLRAIQEREITRVGESRPIRVDVRLIAATNRDIVAAVHDGSFREDLFYRLSVVPIALPPLRDRREDIPVLAEHFLAKYSRRRQKSVHAFSPDALQALMRHDWPGNVRELESVIERAVVLSGRDVLRPADLLFFGQPTPANDLPVYDDLRPLEAVEAEHIRRVLLTLNGHLSRAAEVLGINRKTLRLKLQKYGLEKTSEA